MANRFSVEAVFKAVDDITAPVSRMQSQMEKFTRNAAGGIHRANSALSSFSSGLLSMGKNALVWGGTAIVAGGTALGLALDDVSEKAEKLLMVTDRIGFPIDKFQEWQYVAEQSGIDMDEFSKSMGKFTKNLGEAKLGGGALFTTLEKANPSLLRQLRNTKDVSKAFEIYIGFMGKTKDKTLQTAFATAAFGKEGAKMINMLTEGTDAIEALRQEQRENGIITREQAVDAESYGDAVNALKRAFGGLITQILLPLFPIMTDILGAFREFIVTNKELIKTKVTEFVAKLADNFMTFMNTLKETENANQLLTKTAEIIMQIYDGFVFLAKHGATIATFIAGIVALNAALKTIELSMLAVNLVMSLNPIGLIVIAVAALIAGIATLVVWVDDLLDGFGKMPEILQNVLAPFWLLLKAIQYIKENIGVVFEASDKIGKAIGGAFDDASSKFNQFKAFVGLGTEDAQQSNPAPQPQMISPQERVSRSIEESKFVNMAELIIKDETKRSEFKGSLGNNIKMSTSGGF